MLNKLASALALSVVLGAAATASHAARATRVADVIYDTVLTDTSFLSPPAHSTDALYNFDMSGLMGQRPVSESAPGDRDYNGGRWSVRIVTFTEQGLAVHDPDGDGHINVELTNDEAVLEQEMLGNISIMHTTVYFECPLLR